MEVDPAVGAVVVSFDEGISLYKLQYAQLCLNGDRDCEFVATNPDAFSPQRTQILVGNGAMIGAVRGSMRHPRDPVVVGKPSPFMLEEIIRASGIPPERVCMVGDRLDTDVAIGKVCGTRSMLVLSGVATQEDAESAAADAAPDFFAGSIAELFTV